MRIHPSHQPEAGVALAMLGVMALLLIALQVLPLVHAGQPLPYYLPLHNVLELLAVTVAVMIFALGWSTQQWRPSRRMLWAGCLLLGVAAFDLSHMLSLPGMPPFLGENTPDKTLYFWLSARTLALLAMLAIVFLPGTRPPLMSRAGVLALVLALAGLLHLLIVARDGQLPALFVAGTGLAATKLAFEYLFVLGGLMMAAVLVRELGRPRRRHSSGLLGAAVATAMSSHLFASYGALQDGYALAGHLFKVASYLFLYRAIFVEAVRAPYAELEASRASLGATLETLPDLLFEMDGEGTYLGVHASGDDGLLAPAHDLAGRSVREVMPAEAAGACLAAIDEARRLGRSVGTRIELDVPSGRRCFELSVARKPGVGHEDPRYLVLSRDVTELAEKARAVEHEALLKGAMLELPALADHLSEPEFLGHGLALARKLTHSEFACMHELDESQELLTLVACAGPEEGTPVPGPAVPMVSAGAWADAARRRRPVLYNAGLALEAEPGLPACPPTLCRFLALPALEGGQTRLLLGVANKASDYSQRDLDTLQLLADAIWHISSRKRHELMLREKQEELDYFFMSDLDLYSIVDPRGEFLRVNPAWERLLGYPSDRLEGRRLLDFVHPGDRSATRAALDLLLQGGDLVHFSNRYLGHDGTYRDIAWRARRRGRLVYLSAQDVTEHLRQEATIQRLSLAVAQSPVAIVITDTHPRIEYVNAAFTQISGYTAEEVLGKNPRFLQSGRTPAGTYAELWAHLRRGEAWQGEFINRRKDGGEYFEMTHIFPIRDGKGEVVGYMSHKEDVTAQRAAAERIEQLSHFDQLTGLPNRIRFEERLHEVLAHSAQARAKAALLWIDLDNFKAVNDSLGHDVGDLILREMANRIRAQLDDQDLVFRQSGDEFMVLVPGANQDQAAALARRTLATLQEPISLDTGELSLGGSIGIAMFPEDGANAAALGACAEAAMYRVKQEGRNGYRFFAPEMQEHSARTLALTAALKQAIARDQLRLVYQPQYSLRTGRMLGAEALLRWHSPQWGNVPPGEFIPLAEANGLLVEIGEWVLASAARQLKRWQDAGLDGLTVAINLAASQFAKPGLADALEGITREAGVDPRWIELELTEAVALRDPEGARAVMQALHDRGFRLSIDDFGTGYSSMSYLKRFPVDKLKIDQSFVRELAAEGDDQAIVNAIVQMARSLGLGTIAEGVETAEQMELLQARGCEEIQGYLYSRPLEVDDFSAFAALRREAHPAVPGTASVVKLAK